MHPIYLLVAALCALLLSLPTAAAERILRVAWDDYPPYQIAPDGARPGIDMEIVQAMAERAGYRVQFLKLPWSRQLLLLKQGGLDMAMSASKSPERARYVVWTDAYRPERVALMTVEGRAPKVASLRSLLARPVRIGVIRDSVYGGEYGALLGTPAFVLRLEFTHVNTLNLRKLYAGRLDYLIDDPITIQHQAQQLGGARLVQALEINRAPVYFMLGKPALAQQPGLLTRLNRGLAELRRSGQLRAIFARYRVAAD